MYKIKLEERPIGFVASAARKGDMAQVEFRNVVIQSEGREFQKRIKSLNPILSKLPEEYSPYMIKTLLAFINNDLEVTVYINKISVLAKIVANHLEPLAKGEPLKLNDILHIHEISFEGIDFPSDCAYVVLLDHGWDKVFYYDYGPLLENEEKREIDYSVSHYLGSGFSKALFYDAYDISDKQWEIITSSGVFPFSYATFTQQQSLINHILLGWDYSELLNEINDDFCNNQSKWINHIFTGKNNTLLKHKPRIEKALKFHLEGDYDTAVHIMYPRLEAALRDDFLIHNPTLHGNNQQAISNHICTNITTNTFSFTRFFPEQFSDFLRKVFFASFDPHVDNNSASRNSISHGAISDSQISMKESLISFLIFDQIQRYITFNKTVNAEI
jgi:hypothetical protein